MRPYIQLFALLLALAAGASAPNREALWQHRNLGKAYYEDPAGAQKAVDEFAKAVALAPDSFRERLNYGLALLHAGNLDGAIEQLKIAQKLEPAMPHTWFNLGIAYKRAGRAGEAIEQFERMVKLVPDEAISHYNLGLLYSRQERNADALRELEEAARLNPRLVAPRFQIYNVHRLAERKQEAARALADFQRARNEMKAADEEEDPEWSWYSEIYDVTEPADAPGGVLAELRFEDRPLDGKADAATAGAGNHHDATAEPQEILAIVHALLSLPQTTRAAATC
jgi:tetratricopeptide (TPR) repeat protein